MKKKMSMRAIQKQGYTGLAPVYGKP
jgi:hypothetical protein